VSPAVALAVLFLSVLFLAALPPAEGPLVRSCGFVVAASTASAILNGRGRGLRLLDGGKRRLCRSVHRLVERSPEERVRGSEEGRRRRDEGSRERASKQNRRTKAT
jgi:hypothetical protein